MQPRQGGCFVTYMKLKRYIISFAHLETLLRGEHHYKMATGIPVDAKIVSFRPHNEGIMAFDILMTSDEFEEVPEGEINKTYGSLVLEGMPCMPIQGKIIK